MSGAKYFVVCVLVLELVSSASIPSYIHICKRNDPHVSKCIRESIEVLRPRLAHGIPELNVPGVEPLYISEIVIANGNDAGNFKALLKNVNVYGASEFQITKLKADIDKHTFRVGVKLPLLRLVGDYDIDARVLVVPIKGSGTFTANATNCEAQGLLKANIVTGQDGKRHFKFDNFNLLLSIGDYTIHLDNLFNGDKVLGQAANDVLNENREEFIKASLSFIQRKVNEILLEIAEKITANLDYDEVFPEK